MCVDVKEELIEEMKSRQTQGRQRRLSSRSVLKHGWPSSVTHDVRNKGFGGG